MAKGRIGNPKCLKMLSLVPKATLKGRKNPAASMSITSVQMEKIMARFTSFNQILSQGSSADDDDEDDDETQEDKDETNFDEDDDEKADVKSTSTFDSESGIKIEKVELKEPSKLDEEYVDNTYWKVGESQDVDIDALYDELED